MISKENFFDYIEINLLPLHKCWCESSSRSQVGELLQKKLIIKPVDEGLFFQ